MGSNDCKTDERNECTSRIAVIKNKSHIFCEYLGQLIDFLSTVVF